MRAHWLVGDIAPPERLLALPTMTFERDEFLALPEYSQTLPTGQTVGKRWRRCVYTREVVGIDWDGHEVAVDRRDWIIGRFEDHADPKLIGLGWYRPIID